MFNRVHSKPFTPDDASFLIPNSQINSMPIELQELCEVYNSECRRLDEQDQAATSDWPVSLFVPSQYEENYAYPLLLWFHDENSSENELDLVMNAVGDQNYCGMALRGNALRQGHDSFGWDLQSLEFRDVSLKNLVNVTTRRLRRAFHIHSERIFAAGSGTGADVAMKLFAEAPEWFAGAVLIDPVCEVSPLAGNPDELRGKNVLHTVARSSSNENLARNVEAVRLLRSAGVDVDVRVTEEPLDPCCNDARFIDNWLMTHLNCETFV